MIRYLLIAIAVFSFSAAAEEDAVDCDKAVSTLEINQCAAIELGMAQSEMNRYLAASFKNKSYDPELIAAVKVAQKNWETYMSSHCDSVYTQWREGTIRVVKSILCETKLTRQRTHEIWSNFLTYMDSTPPVLPEPLTE